MIKRFFDKRRITPISSRKIAPPLATSNNPGLARSVSVNLRLRSQHRDPRKIVSVFASRNPMPSQVYSNGLDYYAPGTRRTLDMENGESLNLVSAKYQLIATIYSTNATMEKGRRIYRAMRAG
jgi:hypothetical protein